MRSRRSCDIEEFCEPLRNRSSVSFEQGETNGRKRREVADYLVAQIELFSSMCLGRSYNCIHILELQVSRLQGE